MKQRVYQIDGSNDIERVIAALRSLPITDFDGTRLIWTVTIAEGEMHRTLARNDEYQALCRSICDYTGNDLDDFKEEMLIKFAPEKAMKHWQRDEDGNLVSVVTEVIVTTSQMTEKQLVTHIARIRQFAAEFLNFVG